jgi:dTDP-4-dehydrorhamnose reductase
VVGTKKLLQKIVEAKAVPIFFSSDYVFKYSEKPLRENDEKSPITVYGQQKLEVENFIKANFEQYLIFRTSKLMSKFAHSKNILLPTLKNLANSTPIKLFEDQWLNPVFVEDIAAVIEKSIQVNLNGEFHLGTKAVYARAELGRTIAQYLKKNQELIHSILMNEVSFSEPRPHHNVLNCEKIEKALNFEFTEIKDGIKELFKTLQTGPLN